MDKTTIIFVLCFTTFGAAGALDIQIDDAANSPMMLKEGEEMTLQCRFDQGLQVTLTYSVHWLHVPSYPADAEEIALGSGQSLNGGVDTNHYGYKIDFTGNVVLTLTLKNAQSFMDGQYICQARELNGNLKIDKKVTVQVPSDVSMLKMNFDGEEITDVSDVIVQRQEGEVSVSCMTGSFHPSATLQMMMGEEVVDVTPEVSMDAAASEQAQSMRHKAEIKIPNFSLNPMYSGKVLKCMAVASFPGAVGKTVSTPLEVLALEPVVTCDTNASAQVGDKYVSLTCHVDHSLVEVESYQLEIAETEEIVVPNVKNADYDMLTVKKISDTRDDVTLVFYEIKEWHFNTVYFLDVMMKNGQKFRVEAQILKRESTGAAAKPTAFLLCLLMATFVWLL